MNHPLLEQPGNIAKFPKFRKNTPWRTFGLYVSYAVLLGGKVSLRFVM
jgi:hypothetical protein